MKTDTQIYPISVIVSKTCEIEFPSDWNNSETVKNVTLINNFTSVLKAYNNYELDELYKGLGESVFDYCTDMEEATLLFATKELLDKFKQFVKKPKSVCRVITKEDRKMFDI